MLMPKRVKHRKQMRGRMRGNTKGGSQVAFGARSGASVLSRATAIGAVMFILGALILGILGKDGPGSVVGGRAPAAPAQQVPALPQP